MPKFAFLDLQSCLLENPEAEAHAAWQWLNFLEGRAPQGKKIVHLNMDETSLKFYPAQARQGAIATLPGQKLSDMGCLPGQANLSLRRRAVTLVAFIADDCEVQRVLPQVIVGSAVNIPPRWAALQQRRPGCVYVVRQAHGWLNARGLKNIFKLLGACLRPLAESRFFILSMDAAPVHMTASAARAAHRAGVMPHLLPARTTSLMQPLDLLVFARLKRCISQDYETACIKSERATLPLSSTLDIFSKVTDDVLTGGDHQKAFAKCGLGNRQQDVGRTLLRHLNVDAVTTISSALPSLEQLQTVYAARKSIPVIALFSPWLSRSAKKKMRRPESEASEMDKPDVPLRQRLRSWKRRREQRELPEAVSASSWAQGGSTHAVAMASASIPKGVRLPTAIRLWPLSVATTQPIAEAMSETEMAQTDPDTEEDLITDLLADEEAFEQL